MTWPPPDGLEALRRALRARPPPADDPRWAVSDPSVAALFDARGAADVPGKRLRSITPGRRNVYEALKRSGLSKTRAAKIANKGKTRKGRSAMARKAARTRKRR